MHSFAPASGTTGTMVMIHGAGLSTVNVVRFGGVPAQTFTIVNDTLTGAVVGNGASGQVFIAGPHGLDSLPGFRFVDTTKKVFQLVTLTAAANGMHPEVQWLSLHDQGIAYYEVEHAPDSFHFSPVGAVASHHKDTASYIFTDSVARTGMNLYRLSIAGTAGRV